jgi:hypothetical protein
LINGRHDDHVKTIIREKYPVKNYTIESPKYEAGLFNDDKKIIIDVLKEYKENNKIVSDYLETIEDIQATAEEYTYTGDDEEWDKSYAAVNSKKQLLQKNSLAVMAKIIEQIGVKYSVKIVNKPVFSKASTANLQSELDKYIKSLQETNSSKYKMNLSVKGVNFNDIKFTPAQFKFLNSYYSKSSSVDKKDDNLELAEKYAIYEYTTSSYSEYRNFFTGKKQPLYNTDEEYALRSCLLVSGLNKLPKSSEEFSYRGESGFRDYTIGMMSSSKETSGHKFFYSGGSGYNYSNGLNNKHYIIKNNGLAKDVSAISFVKNEGELLISNNVQITKLFSYINNEHSNPKWHYEICLVELSEMHCEYT